VRLWSEPHALQDNECDSSDNLYPLSKQSQRQQSRACTHRNEVERQIHEVPNNSRRSEFGKRLASQLAEPGNHVSSTTTLDLAFLRNKLRVATLDESSVKSVDETVFDEQSLAQDHGESAGFAEHEQRCGEGGKWTRGEEHHSGLREVGEEEHEGCDAEAESQGGRELVQKRRPEAAVGGEVEDALLVVSDRFRDTVCQ
jgi:hypothetical protein